MAASTAVPDGMKRFTLSFVQDGAVVSSRSFSYGDSFNGGIYPALPAKEGSYAHWDRSNLRDLRSTRQSPPCTTPTCPRCPRRAGRTSAW